LGLKMFHALDSAIAQGYERAAIVGTDSPTLPFDYVDSLLRSKASVAVGPADDGGFWGIAASETKPNMFDRVRWSSRETLRQTIQAIESAGLPVELGNLWFDVDEPADLERLLRTNLPPSTQRWADRHERTIAAWRAIR
jgi:uncharacterized protein